MATERPVYELVDVQSLCFDARSMFHLLPSSSIHQGSRYNRQAINAPCPSPKSDNAIRRCSPSETNRVS